MTPPDPADRLNDRQFLALYALAWAGAAISYTPFLTLLLPMQVDRMAGSEGVNWLAVTTFFGAIASSLANIVFGWLSDLTGSRRGWVMAGLALSSGLLTIIPFATTLAVLAALIVAWQIGLNMMLGPLSAWAGDRVPDARKGMLGGLLAFAPASGALVGALVTIPGLAELPYRFGIVAAIVVACVLPLALLGDDGCRDISPASALPASAPTRALLRVMATRMWLARLLVQISEASLFAYFYLWFRGVDATFSDAGIARVLVIAMLFGAVTALAAGRWADRYGRPVVPLAWAAAGAAAGLFVMALSAGRVEAIAGYLLFGLSTSVFLSLHSAHTLRVLPNGARRGRDLGLFNLTNTTPSLVMPSLTVALVPSLGFAGLFMVLSVLALGAMALLARSPDFTTAR